MKGNQEVRCALWLIQEQMQRGIAIVQSRNDQGWQKTLGGMLTEIQSDFTNITNRNLHDLDKEAIFLEKPPKFLAALDGVKAAEPSWMLMLYSICWMICWIARFCWEYQELSHLPSSRPSSLRHAEI